MSENQVCQIKPLSYTYSHVQVVLVQLALHRQPFAHIKLQQLLAQPFIQVCVQYALTLQIHPLEHWPLQLQFGLHEQALVHTVLQQLLAQMFAHCVCAANLVASVLMAPIEGGATAYKLVLPLTKLKPVVVSVKVFAGQPK
jgi:hypothetical protein